VQTPQVGQTFSVCGISRAGGSSHFTTTELFERKFRPKDAEDIKKEEAFNPHSFSG